MRGKDVADNNKQIYFCPNKWDYLPLVHVILKGINYLYRLSFLKWALV